VTENLACFAVVQPAEEDDASLDYRRTSAGQAPLRPPDGPASPAADLSVPILPGEGDTDYARYMRTGVLLSLQRGPGERIHRDELLFQTVHQTTELWLKHACFEVEEAAAQVRRGCTDAAVRLLARASLAVDLVTGQLEMLRHLTPWDFQVVRTALGHGSGFESPGWRNVQQVSEHLRQALDEVLSRHRVDLVELYRGSPDDPLYRLTEAMVEWDERISLWRVRHFKVATRIIGHDVIGTKGTPVDVLTRLIGQKVFPELWRVRTELTRTGPLSQPGGPYGQAEPAGTSPSPTSTRELR
jgi:tryptophan 2,3-dioxygenase